MSAMKYHEALLILNSLVTSREYSLAAVWMKHGDCHRALGNVESAVISYKNCVRLAPGHLQAHLLYSKMLRKAEKFSQAAQVKLKKRFKFLQYHVCLFSCIFIVLLPAV